MFTKEVNQKQSITKLKKKEEESRRSFSQTREEKKRINQ